MELNLTLVVFASSIHDGLTVAASRENIYSEFKSRYALKVVSSQEYEPIKGQEELAIAFIATGGTEQTFLNDWQKFTRPLVILSDSFHNSLAASLEISSWMNNNGIKHRHINFPISPSKKFLEELHDEIALLYNIQRAFKEISNTRIGLFGDPSPWLISSDVNKEMITQKFGAKFIDIPISLLENNFNAFSKYQGKYAMNSAESTMLLNNLTSHIEKSRTENDLFEAVKLYNSLKDLIQKNELNALSIKCFDIINTCKTTACLALSIFNDRGLVSGCEGDIPTLWSMIIARALLNKTSFMANPSSIDRSDNTVDFSHCTAPLSMSDSFALPSHYESQSGIGISAKLSLGKYTIFKCGGPNLDRFIAINGEIIQNTDVVERCRTQIKFRFKSGDDMDDFLNSHLGNHVIIIQGKHKKEISRFFELY